MTHDSTINTFYVILSTSAVTEELLALSDNSSIDYLRRNADGTKCVLQFSGDIPDIIAPYNIYSAENAQGLLSSEEWQPLPTLTGGFWEWVWR